MPRPQKPQDPAKIKNPLDAFVGRKLRERRNLLGWTQNELAEKVGITFQQVQKYENGVNRLGASRLFKVATTMGVPIDFFFEGFTNFAHSEGGAALTHLASSMVMEEGKSLQSDVMEQKETLDLVRHYYALPNDAARKKVMEMMKLLQD